jgi:hypothetical protein
MAISWLKIIRVVGIFPPKPLIVEEYCKYGLAVI